MINNRIAEWKADVNLLNYTLSAAEKWSNAWRQPGVNCMCNFVSVSLPLDIHCLDKNSVTEQSRTKMVQDPGSR